MTGPPLLGKQLREGDRRTRALARDKLRRLHGDKPYNGGSNICRGDGYFAESIRRDFGMSLDEVAKLSGYQPDSEVEAAKNRTIRRLRQRVKELEAQVARLEGRDE